MPKLKFPLSLLANFSLPSANLSSANGEPKFAVESAQTHPFAANSTRVQKNKGEFCRTLANICQSSAENFFSENLANASEFTVNTFRPSLRELAANDRSPWSGCSSSNSSNNYSSSKMLSK